ncbi:hypothetical protein OIV83_004753 [Microbotryomycetes sp. JL201]|nr:hypothetical protein OIV83_004753 [Microbotryomycetes sp. JL201]
MHDPEGGLSTTTTSQNGSLLAKIKRTVSQRRASLSFPKFLSPNSAEDTAQDLNTSDDDRNGNMATAEDGATKAFTIAPPSHRENTPIHALMDTLPSLPTFPSFPSGVRRRGPSAANDDDVNGSRTPDRRPSTTDKIVRTYKGDPFSQGSVLRDKKTHRRLWIPIKTGLTIRKVDLSIGLTDDDEARTTETIVASTQVMQIVGVLDLGKRLKDRIKSLEARTTAEAAAAAALAAPPPRPSRPAPVHFVNHGYDWRRRLELSSAELIERLERLKAESKARGEGPDSQGEGATVIAHSMGGLVLLHALATCSDPTIFKGIIFAGVPFHGTANILSPFRYGDRLLLNRDVCSPSAVFSMRSSFYMLPRSGLCFETPAGEPIPIDFFDARSWSKYNLSPMTANLYTSLNEMTGNGDENRTGRDALREQATHASGGLGVGLDINMAEQTVDVPDSETSPSEDKMATALSTKPPFHRRTTLEQVSPIDARMNLPSLANDDEVRIGQVEYENEDPQAIVDGRERTNSSSSASSSEPEDGTNVNRHQRQASFSELSKVMSSSDHDISSYLKQTLKRVQQFYDDIDNSYDSSKAYPPIVLLTSRKTPTVRGCIMPSRSAIATTQYTDLLFDEGDGIVLYSSSSSLPSGPNKWNRHVKAVVESTFGHVSLIGDLSAIKQCLHELYG